MYENLVKTVNNDYNGKIQPLIIDSKLTNGTGICNPSILVEDDKIHLILRHVEYTLYICENEQKYQSANQGPLSYYHREDKNELKTNNYYCELDKDSLEIKRYHKIDTSKLDVKPIWTFIGLEDARLVKWSDKYYLCGVRRDTTTNGQGRMELSEIEINDDSVKEVNRSRIEVENKESYCEKNWMPVLDNPFQFVKWTNPTEIVQVDIENDNCQTVKIKTKRDIDVDLRGGSQVIKWRNYYLAVTHEVDLFNNEAGRKDAVYRHRFVLWDKNWKLLRWTRDFSLMSGHVEFCAGLAHRDNEFILSFGFQDNAAYILKFPEKVVEDLFNE